MIEKAKAKFTLSYACLANQVGLSYRTLMRWKRRLANGQAAVEKRGPKKIRAFNLNELKAKIRDLAITAPNAAVAPVDFMVPTPTAYPAGN